MNLISMSSQQITCPNYVIAGNVGIGTTNPTQQLDVNGAIAVGGVTVIDASGNITGNGSNITNLDATAITTGTLDAARLATSGVVAGSYGSITEIPVVTVDTYGRVTVVSSTVISIPTNTNQLINGSEFLTVTPTTLPATTFTGNVIADNSRMGTVTGIASTFAGFGHNSQWASGSYALLQDSTGKTLLNCASNQTIAFRVNNTQKMTMDTDGNLTATSFIGNATTATIASALTDGQKIVIQNTVDGGSSRGIFMWSAGDSNWGIYMAQSGALKSLAGATACTSLDGRVAHHIRNRVSDSSAAGFIWENGAESCLMSLTGDTGNLRTKGVVTSTQLTVSNNTNAGGGYILSQNVNAGSSAYPVFQLQSDTGSFYIWKNSSTRTTDGGVKTTTLRNDDGDVRISAKADSPYIYLQASSGNVGIGSGTPAQKLDVAGAIAISGTTVIDGSRNINAAGISSSAGSGTSAQVSIFSSTRAFNFVCSATVGAYNNLTAAGDHLIWFTDGTPGTGNLLIAPWISATSGIKIIGATGYVGIGKIPTTALDVNGTVTCTNLKSTGWANLAGAGSYAVANGFNTAAGCVTIGDHGVNYGGNSGWNTNTAGLLMECLDKTEIMVHDSGQRLASLMYYNANTVTIGRDTGNGSALAGGTLTGSWSLTGTVTVPNGNSSYTLYGPNTSWSAYLYVGSGPPDTWVTAGASVTSTNGNLHLDCRTGYATYLNWYPSGSTRSVLRGGGATTFDAGSDERIKTDITLADTSICWNNIKSLPLKRFKYNVEAVPTFATNADTHILGFIAQDAQINFPKSVALSTEHTKDQYTIPEVLTLNKDQIIMTLYGCVQEAQKRIEAQQAQINSLTISVERLLAAMDSSA